MPAAASAPFGATGDFCISDRSQRTGHSSSQILLTGLNATSCGNSILQHAEKNKQAGRETQRYRKENGDTHIHTHTLIHIYTPPTHTYILTHTITCSASPQVLINLLVQAAAEGQSSPLTHEHLLLLAASSTHTHTHTTLIHLSARIAADAADPCHSLYNPCVFDSGNSGAVRR